MSCIDYYDEAAPKIEIELDSRLSPAANAQRYYKLYNKAKTANGQDFDGMIAVNNRKRMLLNRLVTMANVKASETITTGKATKFNGEGNQTVYCYDIKEVTTIDFDRNKVKAIANRLRKELDDTSTKIDVMQLETMVEYETELDIGDNLEDAIEKWKVSKN